MAEKIVDIDITDLFTVSPEESEVLKKAILSPSNVSVRYDRKINMGNYESLGVGIGVTFPIGLSDEEYEVFSVMAGKAIDQANKLAAKETNDKVVKIKAKKRANKNGNQ